MQGGHHKEGLEGRRDEEKRVDEVGKGANHTTSLDRH